MQDINQSSVIESRVFLIRNKLKDCRSIFTFRVRINFLYVTIQKRKTKKIVKWGELLRDVSNGGGKNEMTLRRLILKNFIRDTHGERDTSPPTVCLIVTKWDRRRERKRENRKKEKKRRRRKNDDVLGSEPIDSSHLS